MGTEFFKLGFIAAGIFFGMGAFACGDSVEVNGVFCHKPVAEMEEALHAGLMLQKICRAGLEGKLNGELLDTSSISFLCQHLKLDPNPLPDQDIPDPL